MKLRKKALLPAIAMVLASVIALSGVTYAWFTTSEEATVGTLDVNVAVADGIQVSLDAFTWKSTITADEIKEAATKGLDAYSDAKIAYPQGTGIYPVSSAGYVNGGLMDIFNGGYAEDGDLYSAKIGEERTTGGNIVAFDLFINSGSEQKIKLVFGESGKASYVKGTSTTAHTETAVRVAFLPFGADVDPGKAQDLATLESIYEGKAVIWEPHATTRANNAPGDKLTTSGFKAAFGTMANGYTAEEMASSIEGVSTVTSGDTVQFQLYAGINKIRVYIWLEGQDVDCVNEISNGDFIANLYFQLVN